MALRQACNALWLATLALMTAFMHTQAPAHRYLLARRIARNFATLQTEDCYAKECRKVFRRLSLRWMSTADLLASQLDRPRGGVGALLRLS
jgi:hypothetical protein